MSSLSISSQLGRTGGVSGVHVERAEWIDEMEGFRLKAAAIGRILQRFHDEDLSTRQYVQPFLDEEWEKLRDSYESLRDRFASDEPS